MLHTVHNLAEHEVERRAQWMQNLAFRRGILPVAVSDEVAISLKRRYRIDFSPVIANRIPLAPYMSCREKRDIVRRELGFESNQLLFTCVALFRPQKNHSLLISAFASGPGRNKHNQLLLVGTGPTQAAAEEQARQLGIDGQVHFLGMRNDVADILGASDVFVLASDFEGNPLAVMEAMAAGLPIVSTRAGGVPELLTDGCEGILVPVMDSVALVRALVRIEQRDLRCSMSSAATLRARKSFDVNVMVSAYESLYEELLQSRMPR
jgi:glycosyltransferase involved in cell wall biosynthesis